VIWWSCVVGTVVLDRPGLADLTQLAVLTGLLAALAVPKLRMAVVASPLGLRVNNGWRERRFRWTDVVSFRSELSFAGGRVVAVLRSGEAVGLAATGCGPTASRRRRGRRLRAMQERLTGYRSYLVSDVASGAQ
jgi:hypothetical protein